MKRYPKIIRYVLSPKWVGNSLYILLPSLINQDWKMSPENQIIMEYHVDKKTLILKGCDSGQSLAAEEIEKDRLYFEEGVKVPQEMLEVTK